ncbi:MAG: hypothetical protein EOP35_00335 [Rubrivivax sp.]|nr:MAG: hypothetical protein EOP35_00335 [Rubrivivax sp.]
MLRVQLQPARRGGAGVRRAGRRCGCRSGVMADLLSSIWRDGPPARLTPRDWEVLLGQARRSRLLARLALEAASWPGELPTPQREYLQGGLRLVPRQRREVLSELSRMRDALRDVQHPVVLLKGAAYLLADLPPSRGRVFSDIDILVPRPALDAVERSLQAAGWASQERDAYNQRYYRQWMHEVPPLEHVQRGSVIDLHHTISPPTSRFHVDGALLLQRALPIAASGFHMLAPEDMVLHSAVHLYQEGEFDHGLRDLLDLHDLLQHFERETGFWPRLLARAAELRLSEPLTVLLEQRGRLLGAAAPAEHRAAVEALRPSWPVRATVSALLNRAMRPQHPACDTWDSDLARRLLYIRSHRLRMPLRLLVPHLLRKAWMARWPDRPEAVPPA